ncbi:DNA double-strand break repair and v(D)J recombination protein XRCC4 domain-containing protein [Phthorimaea operculella]|nr:DNA double-strand break repair and v(D)J recombination protein XRCC4 domain-containing protein [Phthorimaea operculella]
MDSATFVSSFQLANGNKLYAKVVWIENETDLFHIEIYDKQDMWTGRFSEEFAERFRERNQQETEEYRKNVKASLMNKNNSVFEFVRAIDGDTAAAQFNWKTTHFEESEPITMLHGSVPVHKNNSHDTNNIIDFLIEENQSLKSLVDKYETNIHELTGDLDQSKSELQKFINIKNSLENTVYDKFIHLLNGKKRRIQLLEENLIMLGAGNKQIESEVD